MSADPDPDKLPPKLPPEILRSRIFAEGGFLYIPDLVPADAINELETEAMCAREQGRRNVLAISSGTEVRGGSPDRAFTTAPGSAAQWRIFAASPLVARLAQVCGLQISPLGGGSYSYYEETGDFLGLHRDIVACDLTVITCVRATSAQRPGRDRAFTRIPDSPPRLAALCAESVESQESDAGVLLVYSKHMSAPIAAARAAGQAVATPAPIGRGETVALLGGFVPHELTAMRPGQKRIVSIMCYRVALATEEMHGRKN